jgi:protein involved in polysaccharide export with SLBB domain
MAAACPKAVKTELPMKNMPRCFNCFVLMALSALLLTGCAGSTAVNPTPQSLTTIPAPTARPIASSSTALGPGDVIDIKFAYSSQFNESQTVRPDGKIVLQLLGPVTVQGKTPDALREEIEGLYAGQLKHPELAVVVRSFHERRIYVGGEVNKPGLVEMPGAMTALEAIMHSGGFNLEKAEVQNVVVVRQKEGRYTGYALNFKDALGGQETQSFILEPRDIVYVPRTQIADINQWVSQYFYKLVPPFSMGISWYAN